MLSWGETKDLRQISKQDRVWRGRGAHFLCFSTAKKYETLVAPGQSSKLTSSPLRGRVNNWVGGRIGCFRAWFTISLHAKIWMSRRRRRDAIPPPPSAHFSAPKHRGDKNIRLLSSTLLWLQASRNWCNLWEFVLFIYQTFVLQSEMDDNIHATYTPVYWGAVAVIFLRASEAEAVLN